MPIEITESSCEVVRRMKHTMSLEETEEGRMKGINFQPRPDDVFVVTPPKCGTTWVCQIIQTLRTRGDMSFEEINLAIPCIETAHDVGIPDLDAHPQPGAVRVFKTHCWRRDTPRGAGKYIYVVRDPLDVGPSFYFFLRNWYFEEGEIGMDLFLQEFFLARGEAPTPMQNASMWHNMASWYPHRADPDVLWLHYEDLHQDRAACVRLIAEFLRLGQDDPGLQALAVAQSDIGFMKQFPSKYDEHHLKLTRNEACGRARTAGLEGSTAGKVREGAVGRNREVLSPESRTTVLRKWAEVMLPATGYASYQDMRQGINRELGRPFASYEARVGASGSSGCSGGGGERTPWGLASGLPAEW